MTVTYGQTGTQTYTQTHGHVHGQPDAHGHGRGHELHVLDDRDILTDLLLCAKQLLSAYGTARTECTNPQLRQTLKQISKTEADFHTKAFEMMQQRGWYETPRSDAQLAKQIGSLWTQKMQRPEGQHQHNYQQNQQYQQYGNHGQQWQQQHGDGQSWQQQGWGGQGSDQWNQGSNTQHWQTAKVAAKTWDASRQSSGGTLPGAHT